MRVLICVLGLLAASTASAASPKAKVDDKKRQAQIDALEPFNALIAEWRGNGFVPGKDKNKFGWEETSQWVWQLKGDVCIKFVVTGGKTLAKGSLTYDPAEKQFSLKAVRVDKQEVTYVGELADDKKSFVLTAELPDSKEQEKITIKFLDNIRMVMEVERAKAGKDLQLVAQIGATKKGEKISGTTDTGPKCVVTGGPGTSGVSHKGVGYSVCCTGCRDAFNEDPEKWIAQAKKKGYIQ